MCADFSTYFSSLWKATQREHGAWRMEKVENIWEDFCDFYKVKNNAPNVILRPSCICVRKGIKWADNFQGMHSCSLVHHEIMNIVELLRSHLLHWNWHSSLIFLILLRKLLYNQTGTVLGLVGGGLVARVCLTPVTLWTIALRLLSRDFPGKFTGAGGHLVVLILKLE